MFRGHFSHCRLSPYIAPYPAPDRARRKLLMGEWGMAIGVVTAMLGLFGVAESPGQHSRKPDAVEGVVSGSLGPKTSTNVTDLQNRLAYLEQKDAELHQEISALRAALRPAEAETIPDSTFMAATLDREPGAPEFVPPAGLEENFLRSGRAKPVLNPLRSLLAGAVPTGLLDVYYSYNEHQPVSGISTLRPFDSQTNQFALNLLEFGLIREPSAEARFGYKVTLGFGDSMNAVNSRNPGDLEYVHYLHEGFASYMVPIGRGLTMDAGKFDTAIGAESMESLADWNYSRSLLYSYSVPFYGFGFRSHLDLTEKYALTGYLVNGWENVSDTYSSGKTGGFLFSWHPSKTFSFSEGLLSGRGATSTDTGNRTVTDTVLQLRMTPRLAVMTDAVYGRSTHETGFSGPVFWGGAAAYLQYHINPSWTAATRFEYYDDHNGSTTCSPCSTAIPVDLREVTVTAGRPFAQHLLSRIEYRYDMANKPVFYRAATPIKDQVTLTLGLVYDLQPIGAPRH